jgi:VWFA-related protein
MSCQRIDWYRIIAVLIIGAWMVFSGTPGGAHQVAAQTRPDPKGGQQQDPQGPGVVKVDTVFVTVPTIITDRFGQFVTGLSRSDFSVNENGQAQAISEFSSTEAPFNVALLIDTSHSTQRKLGAIRKAALAFVKQLQTNDRVMIVTFDDQVRFVSELTSDRAALERAIDSVKSNYATSLYDAVYLTVTEKLAPLAGRKAIVVLTDGVDTSSKRATFESALELVSNAGIISYTIQYETRNDGGPVMKPLNLPNSIGALGAPLPSAPSPAANSASLLALLRPQLRAAEGGGLMRFGFVQQPIPPKRDRYLVAHDFLLSLAQQSGARYLRAETIESASYAFRLIAEELRHQYTISYYSTNDQRDGRVRTIEVRVKYPDLLVRSRQAYRAPRADDDPKAPPTSPIKN